MSGWLMGEGAVLLLALLLSCGCGHRGTEAMETVRVGALTVRGLQTVLTNYQNSLAVVANSTLGEDYKVNLVLFNGSSALQEAISAGQLDFVIAGPVDTFCVAVQQPVSYIASRVEISTPPFALSQQGGIFVALENRTDINDLPDICDKIMAVAGFNILVSPLAQWAEMKEAGIDPFSCGKALFFTNSIPLVLEDVLKADVGAVSSNTKLPPGLKIIHKRDTPGFPLPVSTRLYPQSIVFALKHVPATLQAKFAAGLLDIGPNSSTALSSGNYWTLSRTNLDTFRLEVSLGFLKAPYRKCSDLQYLQENWLYQSCPEGYISSGRGCPSNVICPPKQVCKCNPCVPVKPDRLRAAALITFGVVMASAIAALAVFIIRRRIRLHVDLIPFSQLETEGNEVLGQSRLGLVIKGRYKSQNVAVKRAHVKRFASSSRFNFEGAPMTKPQKEPSRLYIMAANAYECIAEWLSIPTAQKKTLLAIASHSRMRHFNLQHVVGASLDPSGLEALVITRCAGEGTLFDLINNQSVEFDCGLAMALAGDIALGLQYLHVQSPPVVGVKLLSNHILLGDNYTCSLGTCLTEPLPEGRAALYLAPELLHGLEATPASDVYGWAMVTYEIIYRQEAYAAEPSPNVLREILDSKAGELKRPTLTPRPETWTKDVPEVIRSLLNQCWAEDPSERPSLDHVLRVVGKFAVRNLAQALHDLKQEKGLLRQILPDHAISALQAGRVPSARSFTCVTVYFSDIKGFTAIASSQKPTDVMKMLDDLYTKMDALCHKYRLMKVETIGDSYMLVGGIRVSQNHAAGVAAFALEAVAAAATVPIPGAPGSFVVIRSGFHSGPVTSGVVGKAVPRFCLFGDTVNVASRMESTGAPGRIQMTRAAAELAGQQNPELKHRIRRRPGMVEVRGKQDMQTFWLYTDAELKASTGQSIDHEPLQERHAFPAFNVIGRFRKKSSSEPTRREAGELEQILADVDTDFEIAPMV